MTDPTVIKIPGLHRDRALAVIYSPGAASIELGIEEGIARRRVVVAADGLLAAVTEAVLGVPIRLADVPEFVKDPHDVEQRWGGVRSSADLVDEIPSILKTVHAELGWARAALAAQEEVDPAETSTREALRQIPQLHPELINAIIAAGLRVPTTAVVES